jgi:hypothetical protein
LVRGERGKRLGQIAVVQYWIALETEMMDQMHETEQHLAFLAAVVVVAELADLKSVVSHRL